MPANLSNYGDFSELSNCLEGVVDDDLFIDVINFFQCTQIMYQSTLL